MTHPSRIDTSVDTRADFPITRKIIFLDNAFIAPLPAPVHAANAAWMRRRMEEETDVYEMLGGVNDTRALFARFIGADIDEVGFLYTTSEADNIVANALNLRPGENVVTCDLSYPHATVLGKHLEKARGIELRIVRHARGRLDPQDYAPHIDKKTRLVLVPWVSNINGFRHDVRALTKMAHEVGALVMVDAIQLVGTEPLDVKVEGIDLLCVGTYKWLMAGWGIAPFYVRRDLLPRIVPDRHGWQKALAGPGGGYNYVDKTTTAKFEYASPSFDQYQTLRAALKYLLEIGLDRVRDHSRRLLGHARGELEAAGFEIFTPAGNQSPNMSFWVGASEAHTDKFFKANGVRIGFASGSRTSETYGANPDVCRVRVSPAHYNNDDDIAKFLNAARQLPPHSTDDAQ